MKTAFLASVTTVAEAELAARCGADIIDCKDPAQGALGALPIRTVTAIRRAVPPSLPVSATIGDLASDPDRITQATLAMAQSGCDIVKIGFFPGGDALATIAALGQLDLGAVRLVGLLLADCNPNFALIGAMADARFAGVMLDTAGKQSGSLRDHLGEPKLVEFVDCARAHGLFAGFAGSLRLSDIASLMRLKPNVLGFRGSLCSGAVRTGSLDAEAVLAVRAAIDRNAKCLPELIVTRAAE